MIPRVREDNEDPMLPDEPEPFVILVTGTRNGTSDDLIRTSLLAVAPKDRPVLVRHGKARGVDLQADAIALSLGWTTEQFPADWHPPGIKTQYDRTAGTRRNTEMVALGADVCVAFPAIVSHGTRDCMKQAAAAGIPVIEVLVDLPLPSGPIRKFRGEYRFLSNFYVSLPIAMPDGITYPSAEHAYQAQKSANLDIRRMIAALPSPRDAKHLGKTIECIPHWETPAPGQRWPGRLLAMRDVITAKFAHGTRLAEALRQTGDVELVEGNPWHDTWWGVDSETGLGENWLGRLLMAWRARLRELFPAPPSLFD